MRIDRDSLRDLFQGYVDSKRPPCRRNCPPSTAMAGSFEPSASVRDKKRIIDHISACSYCRDEFMLLVELRRAEAEPLAEEGEALPSELRPKITKGKGPRHPLLWQYASVLIGLGLAFTSFIVLVQRKELSEIRRTSGGGILTLAPEIDQALSGPIVFRWLADPDAEYYVMELFDRALLPVWVSEKIHGTQMSIPPEVRSRLEYGQAYFWMISAYAQEAVIKESRLARFSISPQKAPGP
jgi:hypothetical protein